VVGFQILSKLVWPNSWIAQTVRQLVLVSGLVTQETVTTCMVDSALSRKSHGVTTDDVLRTATLQPLLDIVRVRRLTLAGHILCQPEERQISVAINR